MIGGSALAELVEGRGFVEDDGGNRIPLHSFTSRGQGQFLVDLVSSVQPVQSVEVGLAFGLSTLRICEQLAHQREKRHIVLDPFQNDSVWQGIGLRHIRDAGYSSIVDFREESADTALSRLAGEGERIQFAYIDADKRFDSNMVYFWALDRMLDIGGILAWDDCDGPALRRLMRFVAQHPNYVIHSTHGVPGAGWKRKAWYRAARVHRIGSVGHDAALLAVDRKLGIDAHCIAFRKIGESAINWDWSVEF